MRLAAQYSHRNGLNEISRRHASLLAEIYDVINVTDNTDSMLGRHITYDEPFDRSDGLGELLRMGLFAKGWMKLTIDSDSLSILYTGGAHYKQNISGEFRELDLVKRELGVDIQLGKSPLPVCSVCAKMTIFHNLGHIDCGIEIVPVKALALEMSSGVSYFEQFVWDLQQRGVADIDIPVLILGIDV
jgi:hypothetical protein